MAPRHVERSDFFQSFFEKLKQHEEIKDLRVSLWCISQHLCLKQNNKPTHSHLNSLTFCSLSERPTKYFCTLWHSKVVVCWKNNYTLEYYSLQTVSTSCSFGVWFHPVMMSFSHFTLACPWFVFWYCLSSLSLFQGCWGCFCTSDKIQIWWNRGKLILDANNWRCYSFLTWLNSRLQNRAHISQWWHNQCFVLDFMVPVFRIVTLKIESAVTL